MESLNLENQITERIEPAKNNRAVFFVTILAAIVILVVGFAAYGYWQIYQPINKRDLAQTEFMAIRGEGVKEIAQNLEKAGLIRRAFWFEVYVWYKKQSSLLQAGNYALSRNLNIPQIVVLITGGKVVLNEVQITFPEGFTLGQIKARLLEKGVAAAESLRDEKIGDFQVQYKFLTQITPDMSLEGFLFPDTYRFEKDIRKEEIVKKFLDNFDRRFEPPMREEIFHQKKMLYEIIVLASIIQQEALSEEEMPLISGVFANRLNRGMALQSDATINYITGKKLRQPTWDDTKIESPYNTYLHIGLPPGPIGNPGLSAIKAAIFPAATDYLYFLHPLDGPTVYSKTLDEHNRNKVKFLK